MTAPTAPRADAQRAELVDEALRVIDKWREELPQLVQPEGWLVPMIALADAYRVARGARVTLPDAPPASFVEYVATNYPGGTVISDPLWHAPRLWRAAMYALRSPAPDAARAAEGGAPDA